MDLTNEYENLLSFLEKISDSLPETDSKKKRSESEKGVEPPQTTESVSELTKKLVEECQDLYNDVPLGIKLSRGFDIVRYKSLMRSKLIDDYKKSQSYERPYIGVLELVSSCVRKTYYERSKYPVDIKQLFTFPYLYLIQRVGDAVHTSIEEVYDFTEINKTIVSEKYKVKGKSDAIKEDIVYEIKTLDIDKFTNNYAQEHYYQGLVYAHILNTEYNYEIKLVTIIYLFRDRLKQDPVVFDLPVDGELAESLLKRAPVIHTSLSRKEVPDVIASTIDQCTWCLYKKQCEKDESKIGQPFTKKEELKLDKEKKKSETKFLL